MSETAFRELTVHTAPANSRRLMEATEQKLGFLPSAMARLAASPHTLEAFARISAAFEATTLEPLARETVILTVATRNECHVCVAMHTRKLRALQADEELIQALREGGRLPDARLEAVRVFTVEVLARAGGVDQRVLDTFLAHGHTPRQALEVVLGVGAYTLSTLANRLTGAPVDPELEPYA
ncbi:carboxymuconolactone decarboxylase family protein [Streptomyces albus subsp. chlorinus]|uniref:carboxymuconolactone decarboxylase family protein n=1 Tax=Streptomyces albus TaxID=1888 RepID=UPI00156EFA51|nr:carboxymuconolactone decarboxylase family protein [Streptomyces albus]NSC23898.1 carboxymuconolactone decarboxylase family protein [Streptomyces albus subsp. chlorinus]